MESVLLDIERELPGQAVIGKVMPQEWKLFQSFQVQRIPAIFVVRNSEVKRGYVGTVSKEVLVKDIQELR